MPTLKVQGHELKRCRQTQFYEMEKEIHPFSTTPECRAFWIEDHFSKDACYSLQDFKHHYQQLAEKGFNMSLGNMSLNQANDDGEKLGLNLDL